MKITLTNRYKSLQPFESEELTDFAVITGINGSGKSQLLEQFQFLAHPTSQNEFERFLKLHPAQDRLHTDPLTIDNLGTISPAFFRDFNAQFYSNYFQEIVLRTELMPLWKNLFAKNITKSDSNLSFEDAPACIPKVQTLIDTDHEQISYAQVKAMVSRIRNSSDAMANPFEYYFHLYHYIQSKVNTFLIASSVARYHDKDFFKLKEADFFNADIPEKYFDSIDLISSRIDTVFYIYLRRRHSNNYRYYNEERRGEIRKAISPAEFEARNPPPWETINRIFFDAGLPYFFKGIDDHDFSPDANIQFDFMKTGLETPIPFQFLSSGEKIIIGLVLRLFTTEFYKSNLTFPSLIFLDEPDAHLHPEMSKILIDVLEGAFVKKMGIRVIITTHSPSTVALAPTESLYKIQNHPTTSLKKIDKEEALNALMAGLPNLSLDYKNHKQIFVESPTDLYYYQTVYNHLKTKVKFVHQLYFISNGYGDGNCDQVIKLVTELHSSGNKTAYGVIDWDGKRQALVPHICTHGFESRYSLENFVFDPIFIAVLLLQKKFGPLRSAICYDDQSNEYELIQSNQAQNAIDYIVGALAPKCLPESKDDDVKNCDYGYGQLKIPKWYLNYNGHKLKEKLLSVFSPLASIELAGPHTVDIILIDIMAKISHIPLESQALISTLASIVTAPTQKR